MKSDKIKNEFNGIHNQTGDPLLDRFAIRKDTPVDSIDTAPSRREKLFKRFLPALALSLVAGGYAGHKVIEKAEYHDVISKTDTIDSDQVPIDTVREAVEGMSYTDGNSTFEPTESEIVSEGQEVARELREQTGEKYAQPGDAITVTVSKNGFGDYKVEADPSGTTFTK